MKIANNKGMENKQFTILIYRLFQQHIFSTLYGHTQNYLQKYYQKQKT